MTTYNKNLVDITSINQKSNDIDINIKNEDPTIEELTQIEKSEQYNEICNEEYLIEDTYKSYINTLRIYISSFSDYKPLSSEEEIELAKKIKDGDEEARQILINSNLRLVYNIANKYYINHFQNMSIQLLDLIQEGNMGLIKAVDRYDYTLGYRFCTYAYYWIKQYILRNLSNNSRIIRLPVRTSEQIRLLNKAKLTMQTMYNKDNISIKELSNFIQEHPEFKVNNVKKLTPEIITEYEIAYNSSQVLSLNMPVTENEDVVLEDCIESNDDYRPDVIVEHKLQENYICNLLDQVLEEKQALIIKLRFGIGYNSCMTLQDISYLCGLSREGVRILERKGLQKLKKYLITQRRLTGLSYRDLL